MIAALALLALHAPAGDLELLQNGGFEDGLAGWTRYANSGATSYEPDAKVKHAGARSLRLERTGGEGSDFLKQFADLPEGHAELVVRMAYQVEKSSRLEVVFYFADGAGEPVGKGSIPLVNAGKTKKFETLEERLEIPEGARRCGIDVILRQKSTVWIDDVSIAIPGAGLPELGPLELANPGFEDELRHWSAIEPSSGTTEAQLDREVKSSGKAALHLVRSSPRRYPEDGLRASAPQLGKARAVELALAVRVGEGAQAIVVLQAFDARGVALATARAQVGSTGEKFAPTALALELPKGSARLEVSLCVRGAGEVWFDGLELSKG